MNIVWRDVTLLMVMGFMVIVFVVLPHINPPEDDAERRPPGSLIVEIRWEDGADCDVDLWVRAPDQAPVGFKRKSGPVFNLLRDDLGADHDLTGLNHEIAYTRGAPVGAYVVNLHLFRCAPPAPVQVQVSYREDGGSTRTLWRGERTLRERRQEITAVRFWLEDGTLSDVHDTPIAIVPSEGRMQ